MSRLIGGRLPAPLRFELGKAPAPAEPARAVLLATVDDDGSPRIAILSTAVLNLGGVSYIDSGGLGTLVGLYTSARAAGGDIKLANLTQRVGDQLQITKLVTVFEVFDSEEKAVNSFKARATA